MSLAVSPVMLGDAYGDSDIVFGRMHQFKEVQA